MPQVIVLNDEQAEVLSKAREAVELRDRRGNALGTARPKEPADHGFTEEEIAEALRRLNSDEPRFTTRQVLDSLASMGER